MKKSYLTVDELVKSRKTVTPAKPVLDCDRGAGVHNLIEPLDSRFRGNDEKGAKRAFYESIIFISVCFSLLTSCALLQTGDPRGDLEEKVVACWQAKKEKAWGKAYDCFCEDQKAEVSREGFIKSANVEIRSFHIDGIIFSEDKKEARVSLSYEALMLTYPFSGIKTEERWTYEKNNWCLSSKRKTYKEIFEK